MNFICHKHSIGLSIEEKRRTFSTPSGSWAGMPQCQLLVAAFADLPQMTGERKTLGECEIEKTS